MSKLKCTLCGIRKSSRPCPLENGVSICSQCCAEKRSMACGECRFYLDAENYAVERFKSAGKHPFTLDMRHDEDLDKILELAEKNRFKECAKRLKELAPLIPNSHQLHYVYGVVVGLQNNYKLALFYFNRCLEIFPFHVLAWYNKGTACQKLFDVAGMVQAWNMVKRLTKPEHELHQLVREHLAEIEEGFLKSSHQTLAEFLECEKIYKTAFNQMIAGNLDDALKGFEKVLKSNPEHAQSHGNTGVCHALAGRKEQAVAALKKALEIDSDYQPARQNLRNVQALKPGELLSRGQMADPIEYYKDRFQVNHM